jgi:LPS O-antigen subunit length determinant protein (WzzB/FepE family)
MQEININNNTSDSDGEINLNLQELFSILWKGKLIIISITAFVSIIGLIYSLLLPNIYESNAILANSDSSSNISRSLQNYAGLAGLAGISLPSGDDETNSAKAMQKLRSLSFFENNILPKIFLPDLMALKSWDNMTNSLIYDESIYNENTKKWVRDFSFPYKQIPSAQESLKVFITEHLNLIEDKKTGFVTIKIKHQSPFVAKQWVELLVNEINTFYREKDKLQAEKSVKFLNEQIAMTNLAEVKVAISKLLQEETKKLSLIEANEFYVYEYIDPPAVMEKKSEPSRASICIFSALLGGMLSIFFVIIKHYAFRHRTD